MANTGFLRDWKWFWDNGQGYALNQGVSTTSRYNLTVKEAKDNYSIDNTLLSGLADNEMIANDSISFQRTLTTVLGIDINDFTFFGANNEKIVIVGSFNKVNGQTYNNIVMVNATTYEIDTSFNPGTGTDDIINCVHIMGDSILIGGWFNNYNGTNVKKIARLNYNGTLDTSFATDKINSVDGNSSPVVYDIDSDKNGKIYIAGRFLYTTGRFASSLITRVNSSGNHDGFFIGTSNLNNAVIRGIDITYDKNGYTSVYCVGEKLDIISCYYNSNYFVVGYTNNVLVVNSAGGIDKNQVDAIIAAGGNYSSNRDNIHYYSILISEQVLDINRINIRIWLGGYYYDGTNAKSVLISFVTNIFVTQSYINYDQTVRVGNNVQISPGYGNYPTITRLRFDNNKESTAERDLYVCEINTDGNSSKGSLLIYKSHANINKPFPHISYDVFNQFVTNNYRPFVALRTTQVNNTTGNYLILLGGDSSGGTNFNNYNLLQRIDPSYLNPF